MSDTKQNSANFDIDKFVQLLLIHSHPLKLSEAKEVAFFLPFTSYGILNKEIFDKKFDDICFIRDEVEKSYTSLSGNSLILEEYYRH